MTCAKLEGINVQTGCISAGQASLDESIASITSAESLLCGCLFPPANSVGWTGRGFIFGASRYWVSREGDPEGEDRTVGS